MFKRAIKANHWMAIGLDKWNELENMEIPLSLVRKMRKLRDTASDSDEESNSTSEVDQLSESESEIDEGLSNSSQDEEEKSDHVVEEETSEHVDEEVATEETPVKESPFTFCQLCPGRKFLTKHDEEKHMSCAKHLKRLEGSKNISKDMVSPKEKPVRPVKKQKTEKVKAVSNRKSRRAHLADSRS